MNFREKAQLEFTARCMINGAVVAASEKRIFKFYHLILLKTHAIFLFLPFMTNVAVAVELKYTKQSR